MKNFKISRIKNFQKKITKNKANRITSKIQHFFKNSKTFTTLPSDLGLLFIAEGVCKTSVLLVKKQKTCNYLCNFT